MNRQIRNSRFAMATMLAIATAGCFAEQAGTATSANPEGVSAPRQPVTYLVLEKSLIGNEMYEAGTTALYAGLPSANLEPTCDIGRARAAEYAESNGARVAKMVEDNKESGVGDPKQFAAQFAQALAQSNDEHNARMAEMQATLIAAQDRAAAQMSTAVATAVAEAIKALFPGGLPTAAAPATEAPAAPAADAATGSTDKADPAATGETAGPAKRTRT